MSNQINITRNYNVLTETQIEFFEAYLKYQIAEKEIHQAYQSLLDTAQAKGYSESECEFTLDFPVIKSVTPNFFKLDYHTFGVKMKVDSLYEKYLCLHRGEIIYYTSEFYHKEVNDFGKILKIEADAILKSQIARELKEKTEKDEKDAQAKQEKEKNLEKSRKEIQEFIDEKGSELLKDRIKLGFDYECLVKSEYSQDLLGTDFIKWGDFNDDREIKRPTLEQMKAIKKWDAKIEGKGQRLGLYKYQQDLYIHLEIKVPTFGFHNVCVKLA
ncbi:hypothetical protein [Flectobacillus roseus]|uniref:hypothetical protein n=1 Tax=Flectobacillus roseus TaxID=502259 RepID=UPI0024B7DEB5|nr:hypothetical protein [Flectobacillus roseus]MDI9872630.1 hypothetical protein [Flectobacillus roseus]